MSRPMPTEEEVFRDAPVEHSPTLDYAHQAYTILLIGFVAAPILAGLDKYFHILTDWTGYLAPISTKAKSENSDQRRIGGLDTRTGSFAGLSERDGYTLIMIMFSLPISGCR